MTTNTRRARGEGAIYQECLPECPPVETVIDVDGKATKVRPPHKCKGKYRGAIVVGYRTGASGKQVAVRRKVTASTASGAATKLRVLREQTEKQTVPVGKTPTVEQWLTHCVTRVLPTTPLRKGLKENSLKEYRRHAKQYWGPLVGHVRLDRLTAEDIEDAEATLVEIGNPFLGKNARPLSADTVNLAHVILRRCLTLAVRKGHLIVNPAGAQSMEAPSRSKKEVQPLATEDWKLVLHHAPKFRSPARWTVALAMGLRQGEVLGLRWDEDLDLKAGTLRVQQILFRVTGKGICFGPPKTERSERTIQLPEQLVAELRTHRIAQLEERLAAGDQWVDSGLVFTQVNGKPIDARDDRRHWHKLLVAAGVAPIKLHAARHTAATMMLLQGIDRRVVMDIMGWSQSSIADNYQHAVSEAKVDAAAKIGTAVWG